MNRCDEYMYSTLYDHHVRRCLHGSAILLQCSTHVHVCCATFDGRKCVEQLLAVNLALGSDSWGSSC